MLVSSASWQSKDYFQDQVGLVFRVRSPPALFAPGETRLPGPPLPGGAAGGQDRVGTPPFGKEGKRISPI